MIRVQALRKTYGSLTAVDGVSFTVEPGSVFGLLGPNGAGKSTTIDCISGLLEPSSGKVSVLGHDMATAAAAARKGMGVVPQNLALYEELSAEANLAYWGGAYGLTGRALKQRIADVLELVGLADRAKEPVRQFSGGMQRRLNFGCGFIHRPEVLLLDEPTVGVDPQSRIRLLDLVRELVAAGTAVLYTTHYMEEAETLCDRIGIIDHGKLLALGTLAELRGRMGERDILRFGGRFDTARMPGVVAALDEAEIVSLDEGTLLLSVGSATRRLPAILGALDEAGAEVHETVLTQPSLESLFISLTGRELRE